MNFQKSILGLLITGLICTCLEVFASNYFPTHLKEGECTIKMLSQGNQLFLISNKSIYKKEKSTFVEVLNVGHSINDALIDSNKIWLATDDGLFYAEMPSYVLKSKKLVFKFNDVKVSRLAKDAFGKVWVGTNGSGVFVKSGDLFETRLEVAPVLSLTTTPNGEVWVGTNVGMYRFRPKENLWNRYAEEGYSGYEMPDNIIEKLFPDAQSNVWVIMPDIVSFVSAGNSDGHIPSYNYVGKANNQVSDIADLGNDSYLFATTDGVVYLPEKPEEEPHHEGAQEVHTIHQGPTATLLSSKQLGAPDELVLTSVVHLFVNEGVIWFITDKGLWSYKKKQFKKQAKKLVGNKPSST